GDSRIGVAGSLPVIGIGNGEGIVLQLAEVAAGGNAAGAGSRSLLLGNLLRGERLHPQRALLGLRKLRTGLHKLLGRKSLDLAADVRDAVAGIGVIAQKLRRAAGIFLLND